MAKDKYNFILDLINNNKMSTSQKERVLKLAVKEFGKEAGVIEEIKRRLERIETKTGIASGNNEDNHPENEEQNNINLPKYLYPSSLYKYLFEYNQNKVLKSTCHEIDVNELDNINEYCETEQYDFKKHYAKILSEFDEHDRLFAPSNIKALIRGYLTGKDYKGNKLKDGWSNDNIEISWADIELEKWAKENPALPPNLMGKQLMSRRKKSYVFAQDFTSKLTGQRIQDFRELVLHFKNLFHIRYDNSLQSLIEVQNKMKSWDDKIEFEMPANEFPTNIELFTDVDKLVQAYNKIIELVIEQHSKAEKPKVKLSFYQKDDKVCFSIHHINSVYNKTVEDTLERMGQTYTNLIKNQINGMCNLYLKADFGHSKYAKINLWNGETRNKSEDGLYGFIGGVEHILEFCKNR